jgi:hypothetical protein
MKNFHQAIGNLLVLGAVMLFTGVAWTILNHAFSEMGMCYR